MNGCAVCGTPSSKACGGCCEPYCSKECQSKDWLRRHQSECLIGNRGAAEEEYGRQNWKPTHSIVSIRQRPRPPELDCTTNSTKGELLGRGSHGVVHVAPSDSLTAIKTSIKQFKTPLDPYADDMIEVTFIEFFQNMLLSSNPASPHVTSMSGKIFCFDPESGRGVMRWAVSRAHYGDTIDYIEEYPDDMAQIIRHILFQLTYTFACIQQVYPGFRHGDLHPGNVLVDLSPYTGYSIYEFDDTRFVLPNIGAMAILSDFGLANIPGVIDNPTSVSQSFDRTDPTRPSLDLFVLARRFCLMSGGAEGDPDLYEQVSSIWGHGVMMPIDPDDPYSAPLPKITMTPAQILTGNSELFARFSAKKPNRPRGGLTHTYRSNQIVEGHAIRWNPDGVPIGRISLYYDFGAQYDPDDRRTPGQEYYLQHAERVRTFDEAGLYSTAGYEDLEIAQWALQRTHAFIAAKTMLTYSKVPVLFRALYIKRARDTKQVDYFDTNTDSIEVQYALIQLGWNQ